MKASEMAKAAGLKNLNELSALTNTPLSTLSYRHANALDLFKANIKQAVAKKEKQGSSDA